MQKVKEYWRSFVREYRRLFSIEEIETGVILQWTFGALLFYFFVNFSEWIQRDYITVAAARAGTTCWPFLKNCGDFYFLRNLPYGYTQTEFYMMLYGVMMLIVYYMWRKQWVYAHMLMSLLLFWKLFAISLNYISEGPYDYYHIFLLLALLFVPYKEYFLKLLFVMFYFMSVTIKFSPAWIEGTYFSSMVGGIPLFPRWCIAIATNIVIFEQVIGAWYLLSRNWILQRISLAFALFFHLYSGILVGYDYPSVTLPVIAVLFGPMYRYTPTPFSRKTIAGWSIVVFVILFQGLGYMIHTDRFLTFEGNRFGMFMFESNHQCVFTVKKYSYAKLASAGDFESPAGTRCGQFYCLVKQTTTSNGKGSVQELRYESGTAWNRCDPYEWWSKLQVQCDNPSVERIALQFDHSINGGPFYRIVDEQNICNVQYKFFTHNPWIKLPDEAQIVGYPVQNWYY
jgi:hypothetical protein